MTEFSPKMQHAIERIRQDREREDQLHHQNRQNKLDDNKNAITRLNQDARALGEIAAGRGIAPFTTLSTEVVRRSNFRGTEQRHRTTILEGWALTWKHVIGLPRPPYKEAVYQDGLKPSHYVTSTTGSTLGFVTLLGTNCKLYVTETQALHTTTGPSATVAITGTYSDQAASRLILASAENSHLGQYNPQPLSHGAPEYVIENIDAELISQAMVALVERNHLY